MKIIFVLFIVLNIAGCNNSVKSKNDEQAIQQSKEVHNEQIVVPRKSTLEVNSNSKY